MQTQPVYLVSAGLLRLNDRILLVHETDADSGRSYWALPGGVAEPGETLREALIREVREETGLVVETIGQLLHVTHTIGQEGISLAFLFEVTAWSGEFTRDDPDGLVHDVAFLPVNDAFARLQELPWPSMWQPIVAFLQGESQAASIWTYRQEGDNPPALTNRLP